MGGYGDAGVGCGQQTPCFCCRRVRYRATCADADDAFIADCLWASGGLVVRSAADCEAIGGAGVRDDANGSGCGCCENVGTSTAAPSPAPSPYPSPHPSPLPPMSARAGGGGGGGGDREDTLLALTISFALLSVILIGCGTAVAARIYAASPAPREPGSPKRPNAGKPAPPRSPLSGLELIASNARRRLVFDDSPSPPRPPPAATDGGGGSPDRSPFVVGSVTLDDL